MHFFVNKGQDKGPAEAEITFVKMCEKAVKAPYALMFFSFVLMTTIGLVEPANAGGLTAITTSANTFMTWLKSICLVVMTCCLIIVGWKKMNGASWGEVANVAIGGAIAGSATALATLFGTPD